MQAPKIQEVSTSTKPSQSKIEASKKKIPKTAVATCEFYVEHIESEGEAQKTNRKPCVRLAAVEKGGRALSRNELEDAGDRLVIETVFQSPVTRADEVELELAPEYVVIKAQGHQDLGTLRRQQRLLFMWILD